MVQLFSLLLVIFVGASGMAEGSRETFASEDWGLRAKKDERIQYLFGLLSQQQISEHKLKWYSGGWPTIVRMRRSLYRDSETNFFIPLQIMLSLRGAEGAVEASSLAQMESRVEEMSLRYLEDSQKTKEPAGTVAYWPLLKTPGGRLVRMFKLNILYSTVRKANIPNDLDTSSQFALWSLSRNKNIEFVDEFVKTAGTLVDVDRKRIHPRESLWKSKDSGAFLTWVEPEKKKTRLPSKVNDVDCVVNLNILNALSSWKRARGQELPASTERAYEAACDLMKVMIEEGNEGQCGVYYERPSQVYLSWARAWKAGAECLSSHNEFVAARAKETVYVHLDETLEKPNRFELAEGALALKILNPVVARDPRIDQRLIDYTDAIDQRKIQRSENAFTGRALGFTFDWYSKAALEALLLEALAQ